MPNSLTFFTVTGNYVAAADPSVSGVLNAPIVQPIQALVTFTPRIHSGQLFFMSDYLITAAYNALQTIYILGEPTAGTWVLEFGGDITNPALPYDATPSQVQTALEALPSIGTGNVTVTAGVEPYSYNVEFINTLGLQQVPVLVGGADQLTNAEGAGYCEITVAPTALGSPQVTANAAIALRTLQARIFDGVLSTIDINNTPGYQLVANTPELNVGEPLIYDVAFTDVTFNGQNQVLAPFAFTAPTDGTAVDLTDPNLAMVPWVAPNHPPYTLTWTPPGTTPLNVIEARPPSWRARARSA